VNVDLLRPFLRPSSHRSNRWATNRRGRLALGAGFDNSSLACWHPFFCLEKMASVTPSQLRRLPKDLLLHLIPYLAEPTSESLIDGWAHQYANWASDHWTAQVSSLPRYNPRLDGRFHGYSVQDSPLTAFLVFESIEIVPWRVYTALNAIYFNGDGDLVERYARMLRYRKIRDGSVVPDEGELGDVMDEAVLHEA
jgi:hypothetical protein